MHRLLLTWNLLVASAFAQLSFPSTNRPVAGDGISHGIPTDFDQDANTWTGPFVAIPGEMEVYRTFAAGSLTPPHREISPQSTLVGFEITVFQTGATVSITSLQAIYASATGRLAGARFGKPTGARNQISARDGYAVRSVSCGAAGPASGLQVSFGKVQSDGSVSTTDVYSSPAYGRILRTLEGRGVPFCGIAINGENAMAGLALLARQASVQALQPTLVPALRGQTTSIVGRGGVPASQVTPPAQPPLGNFNPAAYPKNPIPPAGEIIPGLSSVPATPASLPAAPPAAAPAPVDPLADGRLGELLRSAGENLVFVESKDGQGSAFLCKLNGKRVLITNQHVINGNPNARFSTLAQSEIRVGPARAAAAHDLIAYDAPEAVSTLDSATDFGQTVLVGDEVVVLGNTEGARVIKPLLGRVVAIGPDLVEISSEFLPGNSGSPIVHLKSNKVIGVATYAIIRKVNSLTGSNEPSVRRFGYRLDSVQSWQPVNWPIYQAEALAAKRVSDFSTAIIELLVDLRSGRFQASRHSDSRLQQAVSQLATLATRKNMNQTDRVNLVRNFLADLRNVAQRDVEDLRPRLRYDYFQREVAEEGKFRAEIHTGLGEAIKKFR